MVPIIASMISSGMSLLADVALAKGKQWLQDETGVDLDKEKLSPEDKLALQKYQYDNEQALRQFVLDNRTLDIKEDEMYIKDVSNARAMQESALSQDDAFSKRFLYYFAIFWSFIFALYVFLITFIEIPAANVRFADTILGFLLGAIIGQIIPSSMAQVNLLRTRMRQS